jgi:hypothetical protein
MPNNSLLRRLSCIPASLSQTQKTYTKAAFNAYPSVPLSLFASTCAIPNAENLHKGCVRCLSTGAILIFCINVRDPERRKPAQRLRSVLIHWCRSHCLHPLARSRTQKTYTKAASGAYPLVPFSLFASTCAIPNAENLHKGCVGCSSIGFLNCAPTCAIPNAANVQKHCVWCSSIGCILTARTNLCDPDRRERTRTLCFA